MGSVTQRNRNSAEQHEASSGTLPRQVTGITLLDNLPPADTTRWVVRRKADVLAAIRGGVITRAEACLRYSLSDEELRLWERAHDAAGIPGLRVTRVQVYRPIFERIN